MTKFLFLGERPSPKAASMNVSWKDGRLAAKQLFDALAFGSIDPHQHRFDNIFQSNPTGPEIVCRLAVRRVRSAVKRGLVVVAMGQKVSRSLESLGVPFVSIVHPAARGAIRKKERYALHVCKTLSQFVKCEAK